MSDTGKWWDKAWNPIEGCTPCSPACDHCWAQAMLRRFQRITQSALFYPGRLWEPVARKKPTRYFVCNLSDWMHPDVPDGFILRILAVMAECPQHMFYTLTKRPERLGRKWLGIELNEKQYKPLIEARTAQRGLF